MFRDENTPTPYLPDIPNDDGQAAKGIKEDHVYMDAMGFGMGCSCLQVFQMVLLYLFSVSLGCFKIFN